MYPLTRNTYFYVKNGLIMYIEIYMTALELDRVSMC